MNASTERKYLITKFAIIYNPCTLLIEYNDLNLKQIYTKKVILKNISNIEDSSSLVMQLNKKYPLLLNNNYDEQLNNIISNLIIHHLNTKQINNTIMPSNNSHNVVPAPIISNTNTTATIRFYRQMLPKNENEILQLDLNTCSDEINLEAKRIMNLKFEKNRLKPGDEGFIYDIDVNFEVDSHETNEWDEDEDADDIEE